MKSGIFDGGVTVSCRGAASAGVGIAGVTIGATRGLESAETEAASGSVSDCRKGFSRVGGVKTGGVTADIPKVASNPGFVVGIPFGIKPGALNAMGLFASEGLAPSDCEMPGFNNA